MTDPVVGSWGRPTALFRDLVRNITVHHTFLVAAGVAFYSMLALVPALVGVIAVYGLVADPEDVESQIEPLTDALPQDAAELLVNQLEGATSVAPVGIGVGLALSLIGVAWAVSSAMNSIVMAIRISHERRSPHNWFQGRVFALKLAVAGVATATAMLWFVVALPPILDDTNVAGVVDSYLEYGRWPTVLVITVVSMALLYRLVLGRPTRAWGIFTEGAVVGTVIWIISTIGLSVFITNFGRIESTFGSLGAVVVLMVWFYLSAFSVLLGAELDGLLEHAYGDGRVDRHEPWLPH